MADAISPALEQGSVMQQEPTSSSPAVAAPAKPDYHSVISEKNYPQWDKQEGWLHKLLGRGPGSHTPGLEKKFPGQSASFPDSNPPQEAIPQAGIGADAPLQEENVGSTLSAPARESIPPDRIIPIDQADPLIDINRANPAVSTTEPPISVNGVVSLNGVAYAETPAVGGEDIKPAHDRAERIKRNAERLVGSNAVRSLRNVTGRRIRAALLAAAVLGGAAGLIPPMRVEAPRIEQSVAPLPPISEQERVLEDVLRDNTEMKDLGEVRHSAKGMFENDSVRALAEELADGDTNLRQYLKQAAHDPSDARYGEFSALVQKVREDDTFGQILDQYTGLIRRANKDREVLGSDNDTIQVAQLSAPTVEGVGKLWHVNRAQKAQSQGIGMQP